MTLLWSDDQRKAKYLCWRKYRFGSEGSKVGIGSVIEVTLAKMTSTSMDERTVNTGSSRLRACADMTLKDGTEVINACLCP